MMYLDWKNRAVTPDDAVGILRSRTSIFVHSWSATPTVLLDAMCRKAGLANVDLYHMLLTGPVAFAAPGMEQRFRSVSHFAGATMREAIAAGRADYVPVFLSDIPSLIRSGLAPVDVALIQVSPPDEHGNCTLGTSCDAARAAVDAATVVIAEINERMPRTLGNTVVRLDRITAFTLTNRPVHETPPAQHGPVEARIGELVAALVDNGATMQMGIGAIPDAVLRSLGNKHDLGVHTEMFSDSLIPLIEGGVVTNRQKRFAPGRTVASFVLGSERLYKFVHDNQRVEFHPCDVTNDTSVIRQNDKVTAVNSAVEVDLSGQVSADSIGQTIISGIGGQVDFIRGAALSKGGKPIIALPSTAAGGRVSRIVPVLKPGAGVVTSRGHVHWVCTEYGVVNLHGLTLRARAEALIGLAHPDHRAELRRAAANPVQVGP